MPDSPPTETETIESRPSPALWPVVAFFAVLAIGSEALVSNAPNTDAAARLVGSAMLVIPFLFLAGGLAVWGLRARIIATPQELRWRSVGRWRSARWDQVTDYYYQRLPDRSAHQPVVETTEGKVRLIGDGTNGEALRAAIAARATATRARGWGEKGTRAEDDWPRVFSYATADNRFIPWIQPAAVLMVVVVFGMFAVKSSRLAADLGWPLAMAALLLGPGPVVATLLAALSLMVPAARETRRRQDECVTVDLQGIRWQSGGELISADWREVTDYYLGPPADWLKASAPRVVVTRQGTFNFLHTIGGAAQLREIIRLYATEARAKSWRGEDGERLGDEPSRWSSGCVGVGAQVFHYRTRTNRALVMGAGGLFLAWAVAAGFGRLHEKIATEPLSVFVPGALLFAGTLWLAWRYAAAMILVDERGISQRAWNGIRHLDWAGVEEYRITGSEDRRFGNVIGRGCRIRFWLGIAEAEELTELISGRIRATAAPAGR